MVDHRPVFNLPESSLVILAAEIDADRDDLQAGRDAWKEERGRLAAALAEADTRIDLLERSEVKMADDFMQLRRRIEEAVERLKYEAVRSYDPEPDPPQQIDVGLFLAALAEIFGERPMGAPAIREICLVHLLPEPCPTCAAFVAAGL